MGKIAKTDWEKIERIHNNTVQERDREITRLHNELEKARADFFSLAAQLEDVQRSERTIEEVRNSRALTYWL